VAERRRGAWRPAANAIYRYVNAVVPVFQSAAALRNYPRYLRQRRRYAELEASERRPRFSDDWPELLDTTPSTPFDPHYTFQDGWAAREIAARRPQRHVDVGSRITFVIGLSAFVPVTFIDLRPLEIELSGLETRRGNVLELPYEDGSVESISCLHVAEHIGLGRYGDPLDPAGTIKAAAELARVLAPGGTLYFSLPVGRPHIAFNAHRVHDPRQVPELFPELRLAAFAGVDDGGRFHEQLEPEVLIGSEWACGLYAFTRDQQGAAGAGAPPA
jgi:SAM-dependent methyltransferase